MSTANLNSEGISVDTGNDSIVIVLNAETIPGGRTLDVTGFTPDVIKAGHIIIEETATKELKPMPVNAGGTAYAALPANHTYKGVLVASILKTKPFASILVRGTVNEVAFQNGGGFATPAEAKTDLVLIRFTQD
jgi:hypothetical protein